MCGRYDISTDLEVIKKKFKVEEPEAGLFHKNYNASPTQTLPVIINKAPDKLEFFHWGLVPFWAKDVKIGNKMINARAETLADKAAFKRLLLERRCMVPATGFYEWKRDGKKKKPFRIMMEDGSPFAFAGLWDSWKDEKDEKLYSFTIITTDANDVVAPIHDRMPVILTPEQKEVWFKEDQDIEDLEELLLPFDGAYMKAYEVSTAVNSPATNVPELINSL